jgi:hypothetical protein
MPEVQVRAVGSAADQRRLTRLDGRSRRAPPQGPRWIACVRRAACLHGFLTFFSYSGVRCQGRICHARCLRRSTPAPLAKEERIDWLRLLRSWRGLVATFIRLLYEHGSARNGLRAPPTIARTVGMEDNAPYLEGIALR